MVSYIKYIIKKFSWLLNFFILEFEYQEYKNGTY
jgi:hypothetical protein